MMVHADEYDLHVRRRDVRRIDDLGRIARVDQDCSISARFDVRHAVRIERQVA